VVVRNDVSWRIETCVVEADAAPEAVSDTPRAARANAAVSRPRSFVDLVSGVDIDVVAPCCCAVQMVHQPMTVTVTVRP
jgi:hypothetical protein